MTSYCTFLRYSLLVLVAIFAAGFYPEAKAIEYKRIDPLQDWGIEPIHLRVSTGGFMIEFRYRVIDKDKAVVLSNRKHKPVLNSLKSKARLAVPFFPTVGFIKSNRKYLKEGKNYTMMFSNENRHLLSGDLVTIQARDEESPILTVQ
ncbi:MAG: hypothetical protein GY896_05640 [Gammaproteobacteria bacterium]|nr:hypothetical protein [Gammaproteobacteria bacterium]